MRVNLRNLLSWGAVSLFCAGSLSAASDLRLIEAVKTSNVESVRALLKERVDVNAPQPDGATALHWAAHRDDLTTADLLIRAGPARMRRMNWGSRLSISPARIATRPWSGSC